MKKYPIQYEGKGEYIPFEMMLEHEKQCLYNHYQTVERLAERCGTDYYETLLILKNAYSDSKIDREFGNYEDLQRRARTVVLSMSYQWLMENGKLD